MKAIIFYIALLFLMSSDCVYGQACWENGFENACSNAIYHGDCATWTNECGDGWVRSNGTPEMVQYTYTTKSGTKTAYYVHMWSWGTSLGEGMFNSYSFQAHHKYNVTLYVSTTNKYGSIMVYAANGLVQSILDNCGDAVPNISSKQLIGQYVGFTNDWITVSFTFTPDVDYSQIWIYPLGTPGPQYDLAVKSVSICPACDDEITYNTGVVPTGVSKSGSISAGSTAGSGGSGIVTVSPTAVTQFIASNQIRLLPEFHAGVTSGSFDAVTSPCGSARIITIDNVPPTLIPSTDMQGQTARITTTTVNKEKATVLAERAQKINIYPTVTAGPVFITGSLHDLENVELIVFDQLGRKMMQLPKATYSGKATINLGNLNNGVYILQIKQLSKIATQKIIVQK